MLAAALAAGLGALTADAAPKAAGAWCPGANLQPNSTDTTAVDAATLCLIDRVRSVARVSLLRPNAALGAVAAGQVASMVRWNYFADVRPTGQTPLSLVVVSRYNAHAASIQVGQNIAWGTGHDTTPAQIVAAWLASPPHRKIILDGEYRDAGVAVEPALPRVLGAGQRGATYAMEFGARRP
jgi:uncharacterized protein YkwD